MMPDGSSVLQDALGAALPDAAQLVLYEFCDGSPILCVLRGGPGGWLARISAHCQHDLASVRLRGRDGRDVDNDERRLPFEEHPEKPRYGYGDPEQKHDNPGKPQHVCDDPEREAKANEPHEESPRAGAGVNAVGHLRALIAPVAFN